jgi:cytochrome c oxidase assembly factor CtaG
MRHVMHVSSDVWHVPLPLTLALVCIAGVYLRRWLSLRSTPRTRLHTWRAISFLLGLSVTWVAVASPIASRDAELLTVHMIQHLLLMTFAAPLIWLGAWRRPARPTGPTLGRSAICWCAGTATLVGWHVPAAFTLAMQSPLWHAVEMASFLVAGLLFWLPVVQARADSSTSAGWSIVVYLFLATLPCDILSAFLVFSERVAYPIYLSSPRLSSLSVLEDQQLAGALMWTVVTIVYLTAGAILSARLLSPQGGARHVLESI